MGMRTGSGSAAAQVEGPRSVSWCRCAASRPPARRNVTVEGGPVDGRLSTRFKGNHTAAGFGGCRAGSAPGGARPGGGGPLPGRSTGGRRRGGPRVAKPGGCDRLVREEAQGTVPPAFAGADRGRRVPGAGGAPVPVEPGTGRGNHRRGGQRPG